MSGGSFYKLTRPSANCILILYQPDETIRLEVRVENVSLHVNNIFREDELTESSVVKESLTTARDGKRLGSAEPTPDHVEIWMGKTWNEKKKYVLNGWEAASYGKVDAVKTSLFSPAN